MDSQKSLTIVAAPWSEVVAGFLAASAHDPLVGIATLRAQVESGAAQLFAVLDAGEVVGAYVIRADQCERGSELVLVAAGGKLRGVCLTESVVPFIEAQASGLTRVRIASSRPGMSRRLESMGYRRLSEVWTKEVAHVL